MKAESDGQLVGLYRSDTCNGLKEQQVGFGFGFGFGFATPTLLLLYCYFTTLSAKPNHPARRQCQPTPPLLRASNSHHPPGVARPIKLRCEQKRSGCSTSAPTPRRMPTRGRPESRRATSRTLTSSSATLSHLPGQRRNLASLSLTARDGTSQRTTPCSSRSSLRDTPLSSNALASSQRFVSIFLHFMARRLA